MLAQPGDLLIVCEVGRQLPVSEQHVRYFLVLRDKVTQVVALEELATVAEARRRFLLSRMNAASGERMMHALRAA